MPATASPARGMGMPSQPNRDDIDHTWVYLEEGIQQIMTNLQSGMTMATVFDLFPPGPPIRSLKYTDKVVT